MSDSPLVSYVKLSPNYSLRNGKKITKITPHHMAGNLTIETCGDVFAPSSRQASSNYGIGTDGRVGLYVPEAYRAWTSSSAANDSEAVTIEVANDQIGGDWHVSDVAWNTLIELCVDICQRNGIPGVVWTGNSFGSITNHDMFAKTNCPGPYLKSRMAELADVINQRLAGVPADPIARPVQMYTSNGTEAQQFAIKKVRDNVYTFTNVRFGLALDVQGAGTTNGTPVQVYEHNNTIAQEWIIIPMPGGYEPEVVRPVEIAPATNPSMRLDVPGASCEVGTGLQIYERNGTRAQQWLIADNGWGIWEFINNGSGSKLAIDVPW